MMKSITKLSLKRRGDLHGLQSSQIARGTVDSKCHPFLDDNTDVVEHVVEDGKGLPCLLDSRFHEMIFAVCHVVEGGYKWRQGRVSCLCSGGEDG